MGSQHEKENFQYLSRQSNLKHGWFANFRANQPCFRLDCRERYRNFRGVSPLVSNKGVIASLSFFHALGLQLTPPHTGSPGPGRPCVGRGQLQRWGVTVVQNTGSPLRLVSRETHNSFSRALPCCQSKPVSEGCWVLCSALGVLRRPLTLILLGKYRDTNGSRIVI